MDSHLREKLRRDSYEVVVEEGELVDGFVTHANSVAEDGQIVNFVGVFRSPTGCVDIVVTETEFCGEVHRLNTAVNISARLGIESQHTGVGDVFVRGVEERGRVAQFPFRKIIGQLVYLVVPSQDGDFLFGACRQSIVVSGIVGQCFD